MTNVEMVTLIVVGLLAVASFWHGARIYALDKDVGKFADNVRAAINESREAERQTLIAMGNLDGRVRELPARVETLEKSFRHSDDTNATNGRATIEVIDKINATDQAVGRIDEWSVSARSLLAQHGEQLAKLDTMYTGMTALASRIDRFQKELTERIDACEASMNAKWTDYPTVIKRNVIEAYRQMADDIELGIPSEPEQQVASTTATTY